MLIPALSEDLCLGFANTRFWRGTEAPTEELPALPDLLGWLGRSVKLEVTTLTEFTRRLEARPQELDALFTEAIAIREAMYGVFSAFAAEKTVPEGDFAVLKHALAAAPTRNVLAHRDGGF